MDHHGLRSTRTHRGQSHKTGVAEHWHYRLKDAIDQAIILRGGRDLDTADDNTHVVGQMVQRPNRLVQGETGAGNGLPTAPAPAPIPKSSYKLTSNNCSHF